VTFLATGVASSLESAYWRGVHSSPYLGPSWRWFRFLGRGVFFPAIRAVVSTLSCFNHRVNFLEANVKFRTVPELVTSAAEPGFLRGEVGEKSKRLDAFVSGEGFRKEASKKKRRASNAIPSSSSRRDDSDGFPEVVRRMKRLGVESVYCWHALFGYWGGLHPDAEAMKRFNPKLVTPRHTPGLLAVEPSQAWDPITLGGVGVAAKTEDLGVFYDDLHAYLARAGVDGVKVDGQALVGGLGHERGGGPAFARRLHASLESSVKKHFPTNGLINCMCHSTENILNFKESALARVSDDFYPTNRASHTVHLVNVAYNSMFMGEIVVPDWDMFQSHCGQAGALHAAARAVGGCPVYVSDAPGKHDFELLRKLVFPSGKVLRASLPGRPTRDCVFSDPCSDSVSALKIWNSNPGNGSRSAGVVGCFNVQGASWSRRRGIFVEHDEKDPSVDAFVVASVRPGDVETLRGRSRVSGGRGSAAAGAEARFAAASHRGGEIRIMRLGDSWRVRLRPKQWEIYAIAEIREHRFEGGSVEWAFVGLTGMLNGGGAVSEDWTTVSDESESKSESESKRDSKRDPESKPIALTASCEAYGCGSLAAYASRKPSSVTVNGVEVVFQWRPTDVAAAAGGRVLMPLGTSEGRHRVSMRFASRE
jgi:raffinose synthase